MFRGKRLWANSNDEVHRAAQRLPGTQRFWRTQGCVSVIPRGTPEGPMDGWMDVRKLAQLGCTVTHYILLATPPQKREGSKDQPKPVSLNHNSNGIHLAIMCWIPSIMITDVLTAHCPPFPPWCPAVQVSFKLSPVRPCSAFQGSQ